MMRNLCFILLCFVGQLSAQSTKVDSLEQLIAESQDDSLRMIWYNQLRKAVIYDDFNQALHYAQQYLHYAQKIEDPKHVALAKVYTGNIQIQQEDYRQGLNLFLEAIPYFESENNLRGMAGTYNSIAAAYENMGKDSLTEQYFKKSLQASEAAGRSYSVAIALNNLSNVAYRQNNFQSSESYVRRALKELEKTPERVAEFKPMFQVNLANSLSAQERYAEADDLYKDNLSKTSISNYIVAVSHLYYGYSLFKQNRITQALNSLKQSEKLIKENQFYNLRSNILDYLSQAYEKAGKTTIAIQYLRQYQSLRDSIYTEEKTRALANALQEYEADKKNQQIQLLASENALQDIQLQKNTWERLAFLVGILALLIIIALVIRSSQLKAKANGELQHRKEIVEKSLSEKELLLKEIHHRVKNNLQIVTSLLRLQSRYIEDQNAINALRDSQIRLRSMSLLHQHLYQDNLLTTVDTTLYFKQLIQELIVSYQTEKQNIQIVQHIQSLQLDVDTLIPLGLIVTELITNALKHAFQEQSNGEIIVSLTEKTDKLWLEVSDNGRGMDSKMINTTGFGSRMIQAFVNKMEGEVSVESTDGYVVKVVV